MQEPIQNIVRQLIGEGKIAEAVAHFLEQVPAGHAVHNGLLLRQSELAELTRQGLAGTLTPAEVQARRNALGLAVLGFLDELSTGPTPIGGRPAPATSLHDWHRFTCDRTEQNNTFQKLLREKPDNRTQFFYLYGLDRHSHHGLVQRFSYDLEGLLKSHLNPKMTARCRVDRADIISLPLNYDLEEYKTDILTSLFAEFNLDPDAHGPLLGRRLDYLYKNSPRLQSLCAEDRVCCYLVIPDFDWDKEITPQVVRWFIDDFCEETLPEDAPVFFFFFGIEFGEEDSAIKAEVEAAIRAGKRVRLLPELNMVEKQDIQRWFSVYRKFIPEASRREEYRRQYFGEAERSYMEDVEIHLQRIIDELNG